MTDPTAKIRRLATAVGTAADRHGLTVGCAESLTSGQIAAALGAAPNASTWFRGAVVCYATEIKHRVLGVPPGPVVSAEAATAMASGAAELLRADLVVAVSGVGGPDEEEGRPVGTVFLAVCAGDDRECERQSFDGDATEIVQLTTIRALELLQQRMRSAAGHHRPKAAPQSQEANSVR